MLGNGKVLLMVEAHNIPGPAAVIRGLSPGAERHPVLPNLGAGDAVAVYGLTTAGGGASYSESRWTVIYRMVE
jgi:hypothetical protein